MEGINNVISWGYWVVEQFLEDFNMVMIIIILGVIVIFLLCLLKGYNESKKQKNIMKDKKRKLYRKLHHRAIIECWGCVDYWTCREKGFVCIGNIENYTYENLQKIIDEKIFEEEK